MQPNIYANVNPLPAGYDYAQLNHTSPQFVGISISPGGTVSSGSSLTRQYWNFLPTWAMAVAQDMRSPGNLNFMTMETGYAASFSRLRLVAASASQGMTAFSLLGVTVNTGNSSIFLEVGREYSVGGQKLSPVSAIHVPFDHFQSLDYSLMQANMTTTSFFMLLEIS